MAHEAIRTLPPFWCYLWGSSPSCQSTFVSKWSELHEGTAAYRPCTSVYRPGCLQWHKLHKEVSRLVSPTPPHTQTHTTPGVPADGVALAWWWLILEGGKCKQVLRQMGGGMLYEFPGPSAHEGMTASSAECCVDKQCLCLMNRWAKSMKMSIQRSPAEAECITAQICVYHNGLDDIRRTLCGSFFFFPSCLLFCHSCLGWPSWMDDWTLKGKVKYVNLPSLAGGWQGGFLDFLLGVLSKWCILFIVIYFYKYLVML